MCFNEKKCKIELNFVFLERKQNYYKNANQKSNQKIID